MEDQQLLQSQLERLENEHRELDTMINDMLCKAIVNQIAVQRLKKKKLLVRDQISYINSILLPDIIA